MFKIREIITSLFSFLIPCSNDRPLNIFLKMVRKKGGNEEVAEAPGLK